MRIAGAACLLARVDGQTSDRLSPENANNTYRTPCCRSVSLPHFAIPRVRPAASTIHHYRTKNLLPVQSTSRPSSVSFLLQRKSLSSDPLDGRRTRRVRGPDSAAAGIAAATLRLNVGLNTPCCVTLSGPSSQSSPSGDRSPAWLLALREDRRYAAEACNTVMSRRLPETEGTCSAESALLPVVLRRHAPARIDHSRRTWTDRVGVNVAPNW